MFELWDAVSGNLTEEFSTEREALAAVRDAVECYGRPYAETYGVIYEGADGSSRLIAQGAELVDLALQLEQHPPAAHRL